MFQKFLILCGLAASVTLAGCGANPVERFFEDLKPDFVAEDAAFIVERKERRGAVGRPLTGVNAPNRIAVRYNDDKTMASVAPRTSLPLLFSSDAPGIDDLELLDSTRNREVPTYSNDRAFLEQVDANDLYTIVRYSREKGDKRAFHGYAVKYEADIWEGRTKSTATYKGTAEGRFIGSETGAREMTGRTNFTATFGDDEVGQEGWLFSGRISQLKTRTGRRAGYDVLLNETRRASDDGNFSGTVSLAAPRDDAPLAGTRITSSSYDGALLGKRRQGVAGTFHFAARGVPLRRGTERVYAVGAFSGASQ